MFRGGRGWRKSLISQQIGSSPYPSQGKCFVFPSGSEYQRAAAWGRKGGGTGGGNCDLRSDSECLGQKMAEIQDCEGGSTPGTKQAWRGSHQSSPEFGCGACILAIFCLRHSHRGAWSCLLVLPRPPASAMLLPAYTPCHPPQKATIPYLPTPIQITTTKTRLTPAFLSTLVHASTVLPVV